MVDHFLGTGLPALGRRKNSSIAVFGTQAPATLFPGCVGIGISKFGERGSPTSLAEAIYRVTARIKQEGFQIPVRRECAAGVGG